MNVILIGYRCAGKSTVGRALAERLSRPFVDSDDFIETKTHLTIREIFELAGEAYFRNLEGEAIAELCRQDGQIIATGGGSILRYRNIRNLKRNGTVVFLDVGADSAYERIRKDAATKTRRPSLSGKDLLSEIREQIAYRRTYYLNAADLTVQSDERPVTDVVKEILAQLRDRGFDGPGDDADHNLAKK